jgi:hypothetical protein
MWKKAAMAYFKIIYHHLTGGTEKNHESLRLNSWSPGRDSDFGPPKYKAGGLTTEL